MIGNWIFMLIIVLLIPLMMIIVGASFFKKPPKNINCLFGYRTTMSMINDDTWRFAHKYCGKIWFKLGIMLILASSIAFIVPTIIFNFEMSKTTLIGGIIVGVQLIPLLTSIIPVERALNKTFDNFGKRK